MTAALDPYIMRHQEVKNNTKQFMLPLVKPVLMDVRKAGLDPYITFKQALTAFQAQNPQMYQLATTALNIEQQTQLMEIMSQAEQNATTSQA